MDYLAKGNSRLLTLVKVPLTFIVAMFTIPQDGARFGFHGGRSVGYMGKMFRVVMPKAITYLTNASRG
jgi:hypothetical protein